jgi:hypothetical protein
LGRSRPLTAEYTECRYVGPATYYTPAPGWSAEACSLRGIAVLFAGGWAETLRYGSVLGGCDGDAQEARALLAELPERRRAEVEDQTIPRVRHGLEQRWADVEWLAGMLEKHPIVDVEYIDGELVVSFVRDEPVPAERIERNQQRLQERVN